jgi:thiamine-phosphate pyrophosphorylase
VIRLPPIYPITDTELSGMPHSAQVDELTAAGAILVQIREKRRLPGDYFEDALAAVRIAHERGALILINDRVDLALALGADGVHLGQDDLPPDAARRILGANAIIGFSTHTAVQVRAAVALPIDYAAIGPAFPTSTKDDPDEVVGTEGIRAARLIAGTMPLVAIGGIGPENIARTIRAGADSAAVISSLFDPSGSIRDNLARLANKLKQS